MDTDPADGDLNRSSMTMDTDRADGDLNLSSMNGKLGLPLYGTSGDNSVLKSYAAGLQCPPHLHEPTLGGLGFCAMNRHRRKPSKFIEFLEDLAVWIAPKNLLRHPSRSVETTMPPSYKPKVVKPIYCSKVNLTRNKNGEAIIKVEKGELLAKASSS